MEINITSFVDVIVANKKEEIVFFI
jgi:hypothetical protein